MVDTEPENNYDDQEMEVEALQSIFQDEIEIMQEKPYRMNIRVNTNQESKERNHVYVNLKVDWPLMYPEVKPIIHIKNLTPKFLPQSKINQLDDMVETKMAELVGQPMLFEICDMVREEIAEINESMLEVERAEEAKNSVTEGLKVTKVSNQLKFTPVNKDTFGEWCVGYYAELQRKKEEAKTDMDLKQTGKAIFMEKYGESNFAEITEDDIAEETKEVEVDTEMVEEEEEVEEQILYDRDQFAAELQEEGLAEEEPDFD